jgi:hypothetical protein
MVEAKGRLKSAGKGGFYPLPEFWGADPLEAAALGAPPGWERSLAPALEHMTPYKRPRLFVTLPELPRNTMVMIMRSKVRSIIAEDYVLEDGPKVSLTRRTGG